jgi:peroxiredoxin
MTAVTIIDEVPTTVDAVVDDEGVTFHLCSTQLEAALGWTLTPRGLCRGDACVPLSRPAAVGQGAGHEDQVDLTEVATVLRRLLVIDPGAGIAAMARPSEARRRVLRDLVAPDLELPGLDGRTHRLDEWHGHKRLLVAFASWCGCRYDLPGWQALHDELRPSGFTAVAVALDDDPDAVRPFAEGLTMPVLYDPGRALPELFAISNVPTVVWIDGDGRIVRPAGAAHGTDLFADFTGIEAGPHLDAVRRWVIEGTVPMTAEDAAAVVADLSEDEVRARLHFRIAAFAHGRGDEATTRRHVDLAAELAPDDLAVWRAAMPLVGEDPFGDGFLERYEAWRARGSPAHGLPPMVSPAAS